MLLDVLGTIYTLVLEQVLPCENWGRGVVLLPLVIWWQSSWMIAGDGLGLLSDTSLSQPLVCCTSQSMALSEGAPP